VHNIVNAVRVQTTTVSIKTSIIPISPDTPGVASLSHIWAEEEVPAPASFDSIPLENPSRTEEEKRNAKIPPAALSAEKALSNIKAITSMNSSRMSTNHRQKSMRWSRM
jgi:hypothetical protein